MKHYLFHEPDSSDLSAPPSPPSSRPSSPIPKLTHTPRRKPTPSTLPKKRTYAQRKRSIATIPHAHPATESEPDEPRTTKPPRKRRAPVPKPTITVTTPSENTPTPKRRRGRPRASTLTAAPAASPLQAKRGPVEAAKQLDTRPPSFLTRTFTTIPNASTSALGNKHRTDAWSYSELDGLVWLKLDLGAGTDVVVANADQIEGMLCWWPAEVAQRSPDCLKITLCGPPPNVANPLPLELAPSFLSESNILTFRRPSAASARFPTFVTACAPTPTSSLPDGKLEQLWKAASSRAFEIDTESNDGLEDICLLFSQKTKSTRDDSTQGSIANGDTEPREDDDGYRTDEAEILEQDTPVLCRYRTRYYPAKITSYLPRGPRNRAGKYQCKFADDSTRIAGRHEIHTQLDPEFATCLLGDYQAWKSTTPGNQSWVGRPPTPEPRALSPEPEPESTEINSAEYCARERMRDQLRPLLPFLQGIINRTWVPGKAKEGEEEVLDRHATYMQGGRARKSLAYSVHTGDLNEDDCEALMYEVSRWALRGERWASKADNMEEAVDKVDTVDMGRLTVHDVQTQDAGKEALEGTDAPTVPETDTHAAENVGAALVDDTQTQDTEDEVMESTGTSVTHETDTHSTENVEAMLVDDISTTEPDEATNPSPRDATPDTVLDDTEAKTITTGDVFTTNTITFHELIKRQPPRPVGAPDYERLTPAERMGYVTDVLYPEAAALVLSYRRGIRTRPGPVPNPELERELYMSGIRTAQNTTLNEDWVDKILAARQLREAAVLRHEEQVVVPGGTRSRPKYILHKTASTLR